MSRSLSWLRSFLSRPAASSARRPGRCVPTVEVLEDRHLMSIAVPIPPPLGGNALSAPGALGQQATTVTVTGTPSPAWYGTPVLFRIRVTAADGAPVFGRVELLVNGKPLADVVVVNGEATYVAGSLPAGVNKITAIYEGNAFFASSQTTLTQWDPIDISLSMPAPPPPSPVDAHPVVGNPPPSPFKDLPWTQLVQQATSLDGPGSIFSEGIPAL